MDQKLFRACQALRAASTGACGRKGTAQHYAWILLGRGLNNEDVVDCVRAALRGGVTKKAIRLLEDGATTGALAWIGGS